MKCAALLLLVPLCLLASTGVSAAPNPKDLGVAEGSVHKVCLGMATQLVKTLKVGSDGWILVESLGDPRGMAAPAFLRGEKYWVNLGQVPCISGAFRN